MHCDKDKLLLFWSGELAESDMQDMRLHLMECQDCRREYNELQCLSESFDTFEEKTAPQDFVGEASRRTMGGNNTLSTTFRKPGVRYPALASLAVAAAIMVAALGPWMGSGPETRKPGIAQPSLASYATLKKMTDSRLATANKRYFKKNSFRVRTGKLAARVRLAKQVIGKTTL